MQQQTIARVVNLISDEDQHILNLAVDDARRVAAPFHQGHQLAVLPDGLVEGVLLPGAVRGGPRGGAPYRT